MTLHVIEWTHDDGMDQHMEFADLTPDLADDIRTELSVRGALEIHVWEPIPLTFGELLDIIAADLPEENEE